MLSLSSCLTTMFLSLAAFEAETPNYTAAKDVFAPDLSNYADNIVYGCRLPDGKVATVYVYDNHWDAIYIQNMQTRKFDSEWQESSRKDIADIKSQMSNDISSIISNKINSNTIAFLEWMPTGPLTPFWKAVFAIKDKYGKDTASQVIQNETAPISFYNLEDLGELASYMKSDSCAQACYEDEDGVYLLTISQPKYLAQIVNNKQAQNWHKGQLGYQIQFVPKIMYSKVELPKLSPAKTTPINPNSIPDSGFDLKPVTSTGESAYYYDADFAEQLQWLAVVVACKGTYDMAYTGDFSTPNPTDYYTTSFIKKYLVSNEGKASRGTPTFEGICFDYADWAYKELSVTKAKYSNIAGFWMVGTFADSNDIIRYRIAEYGESSDRTINDTPVVVFNHNHIKAHDNAKHHAWFWVQSTDGTIYWIDPTWTDNSGRPVYGIVRNGQEIELEPDSRLFAPQVK